MISRHWTGIARPDRADEYVRHLQAETFPQLASLPGFVQASILRREVRSGTEFRVVTLWESIEAIRAFAGDDPEAAVVPDSVRGIMLEFDERAVHYQVAESPADEGRPIGSP